MILSLTEFAFLLVKVNGDFFFIIKIIIIIMVFQFLTTW